MKQPIAAATTGYLTAGKETSTAMSLRPIVTLITAIVAIGALALGASSASAATPEYALSFGTFSKPNGIGVDEDTGNVFVADSNANTVEIFGAEGGAPVGVSSTTLTGFGFNGEPTGVAVDNSTSVSSGALYVANVQNSAVDKFVLNPATEEYELTEELSATGGFEEPTGLTVDADGNVWVGDFYSQSVIEFDPAGAEINRIDVSASAEYPSDLAVDSAGDLFVQTYGTFGAAAPQVFKFAANDNGEVEPGTVPSKLDTADGVTGIAIDLSSDTLNVAIGHRVVRYSAATLVEIDEFGQPDLSSTERLAVNSATGDVYVADSVAGTVALFREPQPAAPYAETLPAASVTGSTAVLGGFVDPNLAPTTYYIEYSSHPDLSQAGYLPADKHAEAGSGQQPVHVAQAASGLAAQTTYYFRVVAQNAEGVAFGDIETFETFESLGTTVSCPNESFRVGPSTNLPDCRAYELVTPSDTNGSYPVFGVKGMETAPSTPTGDGVVFGTSGGALPGTAGPGLNDLYEAVRGPSQWLTRGLGPAASQAPGGARNHGVSEDHHYSFWQTEGDGGSLPAGNYLRSPDGSFNPLGEGSLDTDLQAIGRWIAPGGSHIIFTSDVQLEPQAPAAVGPGSGYFIGPVSHNNPVGAVYDRTPDGLAVVSLLPGDVTPPPGTTTYYRGYSADGSSVVFSVDGTMYVRHDGVTLPIVTRGEPEEVTFEGVSRDGSKVLYLIRESAGEGGQIFAFDVGTGQSTSISGAAAHVVNISADGSHVYFVSQEAVSGTDGTEGANNLYMSDGNSIALVARLSSDKAAGHYLDERLWEPGWLATLGAAQQESLTGPIVDPSRSTPDGTVLVFESHVNLTAYDAEGQNEIYRWDESRKKLSCISCNPSGAPPSSSPDETLLATDSTSAPTAADTQIPNLTTDGTEVFFMSSDPLVAQDSDGLRDVYEWHNGRISLISFPQSATREWLYGMTSDGRNVFFTSNEGLTPAKGDGTAAIYDARVEGGFPYSYPPASCQEDACQFSRSQLPAAPAAGSAIFTGPGNKKHCRRKGRRRCGAKRHRHGHRKHHHKSRTTKTHRRAGR